MPFIRTMNSGDADPVNKRWKSGNDLYVIEESGTHNFFMAKLYCVHDKNNVTSDELNSYFTCAGDDNSTDHSSVEYEANCFGGIKLPRVDPICDVNDIRYDEVSEPNTIS